jgi:UDP-N-acetyl-D-mannosaminuronic acid dehydrogenase
MNICVVGLGYIGLPTAAMLASRGHDVLGFDVSDRVVAAVNAGHAHFQEPDLDMLMSAAIQTGRLRAATEPAEADYFIIAVPTPVKPGGAPDMSYVESATARIAPYLKSGSTVILESTSPVGSTEMVTAVLREARLDLTFPTYKGDELGEVGAEVSVCHCPERILPGQMVRELVENDRIIGGMTNACARKALVLYEEFVHGTCYITDCRAAELVKLTENAFRDVNIAFANELSMICERLDVDVWRVRELANRHPRVSILEPGAGVGGHCIAVDPWFIVNSAPEEARLIRMARLVNDDKPHRLISKIAGHAQRFKSPVIACYGATYKPDVDDLRESPALEIVEALALIDGVTVLLCEPNVDSLPGSVRDRPNVRLVDTADAHLTADIVAFLVGHRQFKELDPTIFAEKVVIDPIGLISRTSSPSA